VITALCGSRESRKRQLDLYDLWDSGEIIKHGVLLSRRQRFIRRRTWMQLMDHYSVVVVVLALGRRRRGLRLIDRRDWQSAASPLQQR
jgi:hypothetical protein